MNGSLLSRTPRTAAAVSLFFRYGVLFSLSLQLGLLFHQPPVQAVMLHQLPMAAILGNPPVLQDLNPPSVLNRG